MQLWHCRAGDLNSVSHVPHTMPAWGTAFRFWGSVIAPAVVVRFVISLFTIFYQILFDFLDNFIYIFSVFQILIQLYVQVFYYYCVFVHYFSTSSSALVCIWILFCCIGSSIYYQLRLGVDYTVTNYLCTVGWRLFKHLLLLLASESGAVHCTLHDFHFTVVRLKFI